MRKKIFFAIFACLCFVTSHAQEETSAVLSKTIISFAKNDDIPKIEDYNGNIDKTVAILKNNASLKLVVEGYSCNRGSKGHNLELAQRRADNVRKLFVDKGVNTNQIETALIKENAPDKHQRSKRNKKCEGVTFRIVKK